MSSENEYPLDICKDNIEKMLRRAQTKIIFPIITFGLVKDYYENGKKSFSDSEIKRCYEESVRYLKTYLQHDLNIGGKYYDAYPSRNLPKYGVLRVLGNKQYELLAPYTTNASVLTTWIPERINKYINENLGLIPQLGDHKFRADLAVNNSGFLDIVKMHINKNPVNFEVFSFAIIKVHLEKFACKIYRDTRTSAYDRGVDLSTNFGVVYQIKKLKIYSKDMADSIYAELKVNFDNERLNDGNVILVIDDISKEIKNYLIDMKVQSISKNDILKLAEQFDELEDREKILRIVYEEFRRE